jgi:hypothetical protein
MANKTPSDADLAAVVAGLREFNKQGLAAIASLTAQAAEIKSRLDRLEEFQRTLIENFTNVDPAIVASVAGALSPKVTPAMAELAARAFSTSPLTAKAAHLWRSAKE